LISLVQNNLIGRIHCNWPDLTCRKFFKDDKISLNGLVIFKIKEYALLYIRSARFANAKENTANIAKEATIQKKYPRS
jgi:hypothetical protein